LRGINQHYARPTVPYLSAPHSAACGDLFVPRTRLQFGKRAFRAAGPVAWNSLPLDIHSAPTLSHSKTCSRHICSQVPTLLTNCFAEYEQRTLYGALVLTVAMLLHLINCCLIIIIIINYYYYNNFNSLSRQFWSFIHRLKTVKV